MTSFIVINKITDYYNKILVIGILVLTTLLLEIKLTMIIIVIKVIITIVFKKKTSYLIE